MSPVATAAGLMLAGVVVALAAPARRAAPRVVVLVDTQGRRWRATRSADDRPMPVVQVVLTHAVATMVARIGRSVRRMARRADDPNLDRRLGTALVVGLVALAIKPVLAVPLVGAVWVGPVLRERTRHRRWRARLIDEAPDLVELFRLAIGAGLTVHQAVDAVVGRARGEGATALAEVASRVAVGHRLADALDDFGAVDEALRPLASALASAERYGVALGPSLDRLADDSRVQRRRRAEEVARRLPVQMLFPLVLCILPAFALLTVVPLVLAAVRGLPR
jgi:tight adherence protein C